MSETGVNTAVLTEAIPTPPPTLTEVSKTAAPRSSKQKDPAVQQVKELKAKIAEQENAVLELTKERDVQAHKAEHYFRENQRLEAMIETYRDQLASVVRKQALLSDDVIGFLNLTRRGQ